ncbi:YbaY family lipoprotein [Nostocoides sp. F2B08]|uniref:YbaY family lipoprotein n=1 Tax=Nostocoides sp. F2B08 TaxID=2653936 RepID=UPI00186AE9F1|nr:YbaY family lipoprotein [Tetrasphaera sp. F2B08]
MPKVSVRIEWPEHAPLPENAYAVVTVEDVSRADAPSVVVGETLLEEVDPGTPTMTEVEVGEVDPGADLVVRVHVADRSRAERQIEIGDLVTTESYPVLTRGRGSSVVVRPRVIG